MYGFISVAVFGGFVKNYSGGNAVIVIYCFLFPGDSKPGRQDGSCVRACTGMGGTHRESDLQGTINRNVRKRIRTGKEQMYE